jgi:3-oxoacyl-[acyl-carrier-protein] synthase II
MIMDIFKELESDVRSYCRSFPISAVLFALSEGRIPPTLNLQVPDPECDLDYVPLTARETSVQIALANCIGFGSKNSAIVLKAPS